MPGHPRLQPVLRWQNTVAWLSRATRPLLHRPPEDARHMGHVLLTPCRPC
jgi:hypothetical protein